MHCSCFNKSSTMVLDGRTLCRCKTLMTLYYCAIVYFDSSALTSLEPTYPNHGKLALSETISNRPKKNPMMSRDTT